METLLQDIRYGIRMLAKNPGFTAVAVLSLALGIGGNATVYSWLEAVLLHPLSLVQNSEQLVDVETVMPDGSYHTSSYPDYKDYRDNNHVFSGMIGFELIGTNLKLEKEQQPQRDWGLIVTENYFDLLGVKAARGRTFHADDAHGPNSDPYIVLSDGLWRRRFGADPKVVGKSVEINQHPFTVIGIAPRGFNGTIVGIAAEYFVPMMMQPQALPGEDLEIRNPTFMHMMGRLKPGVTLAQARAEMSTMARQLEQQYPDTTRDVGAYVCPVWQAHYGLQSFLLPVSCVSHGGGDSRSADCVRECRESASCASHGARERNCDSLRAGRGPCAADSPAAHREPAARRVGRRSGNSDQSLDDEFPDGLYAARASSDRFANWRGWPGSRLHADAFRFLLR